MRLLLSALFLWASITNVSAANLFELTAPDIDGSNLPLSEFKGKVVLIVNTASRCGFTPQYEAMEEIFQKYRNQGFVVLGFPSNDFHQELSSNEEIKDFCEGYRISFPLFASSSVTGLNKQPVYEFLTNSSAYQAMRGEVRWNFEKFLVGRDGKVVNRYRSGVAPDSSELLAAINGAL